MIYPFTKRPNFGHDQTESICRQQIIDKMTISLLDRVENIDGKGENAGYHNFLLFPQCFQKPSFWDHQKSGLCDKKLC